MVQITVYVSGKMRRLKLFQDWGDKDKYVEG
jgi:hypothetical protein